MFCQEQAGAESGKCHALIFSVPNVHDQNHRVRVNAAAQSFGPFALRGQDDLGMGGWMNAVGVNAGVRAAADRSIKQLRRPFRIGVERQRLSPPGANPVCVDFESRIRDRDQHFPQMEFVDVPPAGLLVQGFEQILGLDETLRVRNQAEFIRPAAQHVGQHLGEI